MSTLKKKAFELFDIKDEEKLNAYTSRDLKRKISRAMFDLPSR